MPSPWNEYGELRGLNAPPRSAVAPAARTARAAATICSSDSTEHGPAMIDDRPLPPNETPGAIVTMVFSLAPFARHLLVRLADVNDFGDAGQRLDARAVDAAVVADEPDRRARLARHRPRGVAHLFDRLHDAVDLLLRRVVLHDDQHYSSSMSKYHPSRASVTGPAYRAPTMRANVDVLDGRIEMRQRQVLRRRRRGELAALLGRQVLRNAHRGRAANIRTRADRTRAPTRRARSDGPVSPV